MEEERRGGGVADENKVASLSTFKSMLGVEDEDGYVTSNNITFPSNFAEADNNLLLHSVGSSSSCSPQSASVFTHLNPYQEQYFLALKITMPSVLNVMSNNALENSFDLGCDGGFIEAQALSALNRGGGVLIGFNDLSSQTQMGTLNLVSDPLFLDHPFASICRKQPVWYNGKMEVSEVNEKRKQSSGDDVEDFRIDGSGLNYDSDEFLECNKVEKSGKNGGNSSNVNSTVTGGDQKGKKKGFLAKNLMAERCLRKKLNDRTLHDEVCCSKDWQGKNFITVISCELQLQLLACFGILIVMLICFLTLSDYMIKRREVCELNMNASIKFSHMDSGGMFSLFKE
ncbi:hypothetical protein Acr_06g0005130 [Actinidia rufa]|uniref:Uncharacterized protein n=1 Tax=Actinidia rufa TaxID=165716 RepID=A0A7J0EQ72_9ERIC|nr:hypothetical protein Acr_06g0005130 [Actinidia rufa]